MLATPFAVMLLFASPALAQTPSTHPSSEDQTFVTKAAKAGQAEVDLATLAQKRATTESARALASQLRTDHERANAELMEIARRKGITPDAAPTDDMRQAATKLNDATGAAFDTAYTDQMVQDHQAAVQLFEDYSHTGNDPDLKAFATKVLPTLRHHLEMAQQAHGSTPATQ
jgi:putative membrane protein